MCHTAEATLVFFIAFSKKKKLFGGPYILPPYRGSHCAKLIAGIKIIIKKNIAINIWCLGKLFSIKLMKLTNINAQTNYES